MSTYTIEIDGRAVGAFNCEGKSQAISFVNEPLVRNKFALVESNGAPLWDGGQKIEMRLAEPEEAAIFQTAYIQAIKDREVGDGEQWLMFLVAVSDLTKEDEDEGDEEGEDD
jgi:hypothetical protein